MPIRRAHTVAKQARERIARIHEEIVRIECLCSGTMLKRTKMCGRPDCACATDPSARHGPYFEWGYMRGGRLAHRQVPPEHAGALLKAIANYRRVKKLLREWEVQTERLIDTEQKPQA